MRYRAIIIKKIPIREHDVLLICYTQHAGKQIYQAKSLLRARSLQASHLDILNFVEFSLVEGRQLPIIVSAICLDPFIELKKSLSATAVAYFLLECFDKLIFEDQEDSLLWNFLFKTLLKINNESVTQTVDYRRELELIRSELLGVLGYPPDIPFEEVISSPLMTLQLLNTMVK